MCWPAPPRRAAAAVRASSWRRQANCRSRRSRRCPSQPFSTDSHRLWPTKSESVLGAELSTTLPFMTQGWFWASVTSAQGAKLPEPPRSRLPSTTTELSGIVARSPVAARFRARKRQLVEICPPVLVDCRVRTSLPCTCRANWAAGSRSGYRSSGRIFFRGIDGRRHRRGESVLELIFLEIGRLRIGRRHVRRRIVGSRRTRQFEPDSGDALVAAIVDEAQDVEGCREPGCHGQAVELAIRNHGVAERTIQVRHIGASRAVVGAEHTDRGDHRLGRRGAEAEAIGGDGSKAREDFLIAQFGAGHLSRRR